MPTAGVGRAARCWCCFAPERGGGGQVAPPPSRAGRWGSAGPSLSPLLDTGYLGSSEAWAARELMSLSSAPRRPCPSQRPCRNAWPQLQCAWGVDSGARADAQSRRGGGDAGQKTWACRGFSFQPFVTHVGTRGLCCISTLLFSNHRAAASPICTRRGNWDHFLRFMAVQDF